jgi:hypothetical protein
VALNTGRIKLKGVQAVDLCRAEIEPKDTTATQIVNELYLWYHEKGMLLYTLHFSGLHSNHSL